MASSYPASAPCPGCVNGTCNGMVMAYLPYYGDMPDEILQCMPAAGPAPGPEMGTYGYGYGAPMFFSQPAPPYHGYHQSYPRPQRRGSWRKGRRGSFKNNGYQKNSSYAQPPPPGVPISSALQSAITTVKTDPQATLFSIDGKLY